VRVVCGSRAESVVGGAGATTKAGRLGPAFARMGMFER